MIKFKIVVVSLLALVIAANAANAGEGFVNGDFELGDLTGWTVSALDASDDPLDPSSFVSVVEESGNQLALFDTKEFADGLFFATLEQAFEVSGTAPLLRLDFSLPVTLPDSSGTDSSEFYDSLFVGVENGTDFFDLLLVDLIGEVEDPFGTAPGPVALGPPMDPSFDFGFTADLSSLAGGAFTLYFDLLGEDDLLQTKFPVDNVRMTAVPEPSCVMYAMIGLLFSLRRRDRNRRR